MLNTRRRLVNFRVTDEEYARMASLCKRQGSASVSELARDAIFKLFHSTEEREQVVARRLVDLEGRIIQLESQLESIAAPRRAIPGESASVS